MDVFLVDNGPRTRRLLRSLIEDLGHAVIGEAGNGREACFEVATASPDVVVMDSRLPGMDGVEATRVIVRVMPSARVIGFAGLGDASLRDAFLAAGACACLSKDDVAGLVGALEDEARRLEA